MEGVKRNCVTLMPHQASWDKEFSETKKVLTIALADSILDIQHIGSTAVPAIEAKPILDIALKLKNFDEKIISQLEQLGYEYRGFQNGDSFLFVLRGANDYSLQHIHCYFNNDKAFNEHVHFRDCLNQNEILAHEYERLKIQLAAQYPDNRVLYTEGKTEFIKKIIQIN